MVIAETGTKSLNMAESTDFLPSALDKDTFTLMFKSAVDSGCFITFITKRGGNNAFSSCANKFSTYKLKFFVSLV